MVHLSILIMALKLKIAAIFMYFITESGTKQIYLEMKSVADMEKRTYMRIMGVMEII